MTTPRTITLSAHSLGIYDRCSRAYFNYRVLGRKAVRSAAGMIAGTAMHEGISVLQAGGPVADQEKAISEVLAETPTPPDDYRSPGYLRDALAAFRAELGSLFAGWTIEERESQGTVELGTVGALTEAPDKVGLGLGSRFWEPVTVLWEFRRDLVGVDPDGQRWVVDWKTSSRNEDAHYLAMKNSGQLLGYVWSWNQQHPDKPCAGALPVRIILRKPSRTGVAFEFPKDPPILFSPERLDEWRRHTLAKVRALLARNPANADDWPLAHAELGCCRHTFGVCDYLMACVQQPADRERMLASDAYEPSDTSKPVKP